jgi:hypothetical protein
MSVVIVVILHQLFILKMSILGLNGVELVSKGNVVLVTLLDFKNLSLELTDEEILLVTCKMHGIVILFNKIAVRSQRSLTYLGHLIYFTGVIFRVV